MRHLVKGRKLGRTASHRKATLRSLAVALIYERRIETTVAKAKELRRFVEPLITRAKEDSMHNRREVFSRLQDKYAVTELFEDVGPAAKDRPGGYTRVIKTSFRQGDSAEMALIELVDFNDVKPEKRQDKKKRTRRAGKSTASAKPQEEEQDAPVTEPEAEEKKDASPTKSDKESDAVADAPSESTGESATEVAEKSTDYNVDEVKTKLADMSLEEAKVFTSADERVTVQKAIEQMEKDAEK